MDLVDKWRELLPHWQWFNPWATDWSNCTIVSGNEACMLMEEERLPEWVVVDGGALNPRTSMAMSVRRYRLWGVRFSLTVWGVHVAKDHEPQRHATVEVMLARLNALIQARMMKAERSLGGGAFQGRR